MNKLILVLVSSLMLCCLLLADAQNIAGKGGSKGNGKGKGKRTTTTTTTTTSTMTTLPTCDFSVFLPECAATCPQRNSVCQEIQDTDVLGCGCVYCNYDAATNACIGECQHRQLGTCINRIPQPTVDSDCGCATCTLDYSTMTCSGDCFQSGLSCQLTTIPSNVPEGTADACICQ